MVKKRDPRSVQSKAAVEKIDEKRLEEFMGGAERTVEDKQKGPDPLANRDFKQINVRVNEYEYNLLMAASRRRGLRIQDYIRTAWMEAAQESE